MRPSELFGSLPHTRFHSKNKGKVSAPPVVNFPMVITATYKQLRTSGKVTTRRSVEVWR